MTVGSVSEPAVAVPTYLAPPRATINSTARAEEIEARAGSVARSSRRDASDVRRWYREFLAIVIGSKRAASIAISVV